MSNVCYVIAWHTSDGYFNTDKRDIPYLWHDRQGATDNCMTFGRHSPGLTDPVGVTNG